MTQSKNNKKSSSPPPHDETTTTGMMDDPTTTNAVGGRGSSSSEKAGNGDQLAVLRWVNLAAFAVNVLVTYGVGVGGLFGLEPNTIVSAKYPTLVTPAGYAFVIWAIIFLLQGGWVLQQFIHPFIVKNQPLTYTDQIVAVQMHYAFVVLAQVVWTLAFGNEWIVVSAVVMLVLLSDLAVIVFRQLNQDADSCSSSSRPWYGDLLAKVPFHIHFGWILVASVVNINVALSTVLESTDTVLYGFAVASLVVLVLATLFIIFRARFYGVVPAVAVWGLIAVYVADENNDNDVDPKIDVDYTSYQRSVVQYGALGSAILIAVMALVQGLWQVVAARSTPSSCWRRQQPQQPGPDAAVDDVRI